MALTYAEWEAECQWRANDMPMIITFFLDSQSDQPLRGYIRGEAPFPTGRVQRVIVQGCDEERRVCAHFANLKIRRRLPYGGSISGRYCPPPRPAAASPAPAAALYPSVPNGGDSGQ